MKTEDRASGRAAAEMHDAAQAGSWPSLPFARRGVPLLNQQNQQHGTGFPNATASVQVRQPPFGVVLMAKSPS